MEKEEPVLFVLENAFFQSAPMNIQVGDLFLTQERICFIPYTSFISYGKAGSAVGFLVGGLAGGLATSMGENSYRDAAIEESNKTRKQLWGMDLQHRLAHFEMPTHGILQYTAKAISISRDEISEFKAQENMISLRTDKSCIEFGVDKLTDHQDRLSEWQLGGFNVSSACAVTSKYLAPYLAFTALIEGNQVQAIVDELNAASSDQDYMKHLWTVFELTPKTRRQHVVKSLERFEGPFSNAFTKLRQSTIASGKNANIIGLVALTVGVLLVSPFVYDAITHRLMTDLDVLCFIVSVFALLLGIERIVKGYGATRM